MTNVKNILYFEPSSGYGGSSKILCQLLKNINTNRFNPIVLVPSDGPQFKKIEDLGIFLIKYHSDRSAKSSKGGFVNYLKLAIRFLLQTVPLASRFKSLIKKQQIDIVHINTDILSGIPMIIAARISGVKCVCHVRQTRNLTQIEKFFQRFIDKVIVLNSDAFKLCKSCVRNGNLVLIYDGIDLDCCKVESGSSIREEFDLGGSVLVGLIGRIVEGKGHDDFIKAAAKLSKINSRIKLLIVGSDTSRDQKEYKKLLKICRDFQVADNVIFTGWREDVLNVISELDILVQATSTFNEGFGLTCIEAMALKKPVIATRISGPKEIILHGETGLLINPGDPEELAGAIDYLANNPDIAIKMGESGKKRAEQLFNIIDCVKKIEDVYEKLFK